MESPAEKERGLREPRGGSPHLVRQGRSLGSFPGEMTIQLDLKDSPKWGGKGEEGMQQAEEGTRRGPEVGEWTAQSRDQQQFGAMGRAVPGGRGLKGKQL